MHVHVIWDTVKSWSPRGDFCSFRKKMVIWDVIFIVALLDFISFCNDLIFPFFANTCNFTLQKKKKNKKKKKLSPVLSSCKNFLNCQKIKIKKWLMHMKKDRYSFDPVITSFVTHVHPKKNPNNEIFWKLNSQWKWLYRMSYFSQIN